MHLILEASAQEAADYRLDAAWAPLLARLAAAWSLPGTCESLSTPAERARARLLLGRPPEAREDGGLPWTAWTRGEEGAWATLTPCHGLVGSDRITGLPPDALQLTDEESRALFDAVEPLFASEGVDLQWHSPLAWHIRHESLRGLPCASVDRIVGDALQGWQARTPLSRSRLLRRLQNEAQMVLHTHPVNESRATQRALTVNSLWLWGAGAADQVEGGPPAPQAAERLKRLPVVPLAGALEQVQTWMAGPQQETGPDSMRPTLVLCGRAGAQAFHLRDASGSARTAWWSALRKSLTRLRVHQPSGHGPAAAPQTLTEWLAHLSQDEAQQEAPA